MSESLSLTQRERVIHSLSEGMNDSLTRPKREQSGFEGWGIWTSGGRPTRLVQLVRLVENWGRA